MTFVIVLSTRSLIFANCPSQWKGAVGVLALARCGVRRRRSATFAVCSNQTRPSSLPSGWQLAHATTPAGVTCVLVASKKKRRPARASGVYGDGSVRTRVTSAGYTGAVESK